MAHDEILRFASRQRLAAVATTSPEGRPQVAMVYFVMTPALEVFFGAFAASRKIPNLRHDPHVAIAIAEKPMTIQLEGVADEPREAALAEGRELMRAAFPEEFRTFDHLPGYGYVRVTPTWVRFIDFSRSPERIVTVEPPHR